MSKKSTAQTITVVQTGSPIRRDARQRLYLKSLGLGKINRSSVLVDTLSVRGLIRKVQHMIKVVD